MKRPITTHLAVITAIAAGTGATPAAFGQPLSASSRPARVLVPDEPDSLRREVMENLLNLPAGAGRVADFNLPRDFLGRVADRILTAAFEEQFRKVVADGGTSQPVRPEVTSRPTLRSSGDPGVRVIQTRMTPERRALWDSWREDYPRVRDYCVPLIMAGQQTSTKPADSTPIPIPFKQSIPGWQVSTESGESEIEGLHLQLSRGDDWLAYGDGGCLDIARQLAAGLPKARIVASIEQKHLANFLNEAAGWKSRRSGETWALVSPMRVAQWAQDNCKFGWVKSDKPGERICVALVPRYPSRGEAGAVFIPGEAAVLQGLSECGVARVVQSPLLFQAGNLICVWDAAKKQRVLLIGEAEIYRNVALGLTRTQVEEAFRIEFGVDKCVVLPAASFHIDYEVSVRSIGNRTVALVNDEPAAIKAVLASGIEVMSRTGDLQVDAPARLEQLIQRGDAWLLPQLAGVLEAYSGVGGAFSQAFADKFSRGLADSGVGNFLCFLHALDLWVAHFLKPKGPPAEANMQAFQDAMLRRAEDRKRLQADLRSLGWEVAAIPSMGDSKRALNYLNGIHDRTRFFMPAYGGTFEKVDQAAQAAVRKAFGPSVEIVPIRCAESQRREGAVRCSAAVMYGPPSFP